MCAYFQDRKLACTLSAYEFGDGDRRIALDEEELRMVDGRRRGARAQLS